MESITKKLILLTLALYLVLESLALAQVDTAWVRRYNGPGNSTDGANALAVDDSGNVYVTGFSVGSGTNYDYVTIKYAPNGDTLWVRRYNGPLNLNDQANALVVDTAGKVYVTGKSWRGSPNKDDYTTIKYLPNGDTVWVRYYSAPKFSDDEARALAVDLAGNVYVTGSVDTDTFGLGISYDYGTIKYAPNGDTVWVRFYNGLGDLGQGNQDDHAFALAVDTVGNAYVTGSSEIWTGAFAQYATIKYAPNGDTLWVRRYSTGEAHALAVDSSGNVYVTGNTVTIKYAPNGDTLWVRASYSTGRALAVDNSGNVYVTGESLTVKYAPNGDTLWVRASPSWGEDLVVDSYGNIYVTGRSASSDYVTTMHAPNGDTIWVRRYNGPGNFTDDAKALAVDNEGNVFVTGGSIGSGTGNDYATIKYSPDADSDGVVDLNDNCLNISNSTQQNSDADTLGDVCDNCPALANNDQLDTDSDGIGDACDICPLVDQSTDQKPIIGSAADTTIAEGDSLQICMSITDPDGDPLTVTTVGMPDSNATFVNTGGNTWCFTFEPDTAQAGVYNIKFIATGLCFADTEQVIITVNNAPGTISTAPDSFEFTLEPDDSITATLIIKNIGPGVLEFSIENEFSSFLLTKEVSQSKSKSSASNLLSGTSHTLDLQGIRILYDQTHASVDTSFPAVRQLLNDLRAAGAEINKLTSGPFNLDTLVKYTMMMVFDPGNELPLSEMYTLIDYVNAGGGLFMCNDNYPQGWYWAIWSGLTFFCCNGWYGISTDITPHPITAGVDSISFPATNSYLIISSPAKSLARVYYDTFPSTTLGTSTHGWGRVAYVTDEDALSDYYLYDNRTMFLNIFDWFSQLGGWVLENPLTGSVEPGDSAIIQLKVKSTDLQPGQYSALIVINNNDPANEVLEIPINLEVQEPCVAKPGDANASGTYTLGDVIQIVNYVFNKPGCSPQPLCWLSGLQCRGDWNASNSVTLGDVIQAVNFVFNKPGGPWTAIPVGVCCVP